MDRYVLEQNELNRTQGFARPGTRIGAAVERERLARAKQAAREADSAERYARNMEKQVKLSAASAAGRELDAKLKSETKRLHAKEARIEAKANLVTKASKMPDIANPAGTSSLDPQVIESAACLLQPDKYLAYDKARVMPHGFGGAACSAFPLKCRTLLPIPAAFIPVDPPMNPSMTQSVAFPTNSIAILMFPTCSAYDNTTPDPAMFTWVTCIEFWVWSSVTLNWSKSAFGPLIPAIIGDYTGLSYVEDWQRVPPTVNADLVSLLTTTKQQVRINGGYARFTYPQTQATGFTATTLVSQCEDASVFNQDTIQYQSFSDYEAQSLQSSLWNTNMTDNGCCIRYIGQTSSEQEFYQFPTTVGVITSVVVVDAGMEDAQRRDLASILRQISTQTSVRAVRDKNSDDAIENLITVFESKHVSKPQRPNFHTKQYPRALSPHAVVAIDPAKQSYASSGETYTVTVLTSADSTTILPVTVEAVFAMEFIGSTALCLDTYEPNSPGLFQELQASSLAADFLVGPHSFGSFFKSLWGGVKKAAGWVGEHIGEIAKVAETVLPLVL